MKALVTGGAGFIGSHLVDALLARGAEVYVIDDLSSGSLDNLGGGAGRPGLHLEVARVEATPALAAWMPEVDVVYHLAAAVGVRLVTARRVHTLQANVRATEAVLSMASRYGTPVFLASSSEVYGTSDALPFSETHPVQLGSPNVGRWGYACSKAMGEFLGMAYAREQHLPVVIGRLFNTTGPRQSADHGMVLPTFIRQALQGQPLTVLGDGQQTRCFAHVADVVRVMLALMDTPGARGEIFNIGADQEVRIEALARRVKTLTGSPSEIVYVPYDRVYEAFEDLRRRVPDLTKLERTIGFRPATGLDALIRSMVDHMRRQEPPALRRPGA